MEKDKFNHACMMDVANWYINERGMDMVEAMITAKKALKDMEDTACIGEEKHWGKEGHTGVKWIKKLHKRFAWWISEGNPPDRQRRQVAWPMASSVFDLVEQ
jgi:hypothetical protein